MNLQNKTALEPRQRNQSLTLQRTCASMVDKAVPNHTVQPYKKSRAVLQNKNLLKMAQTAARRGGNYGWSMAIHFAKLAYGLKSAEPVPVVGDVWGNFTFTYVNHNTGDTHQVETRILNQGMVV